ncbi:MAG TPA: SDR family oxidoreductase, partial [Methylomirabilota bacterium]|nr:SDR family oxidoreductase [Methylomirabilota bacterium]
MDLGLTGCVALVTGASRGIGCAVARALAAEGARVVLCARDKTALERVAGELGPRAAVVAADLNEPAEVERVVAEARARWDRLDVLVNNAGAIRPGDFLTVPDEQWLTDLNLKLFGYVRMARAVLPVMRAQGGGRIVNVIGAAARNPSPTYLAGGAANAALVNFTKGLADLAAPWGILVTGVSPAATATDRWHAMLERTAAATGKPLEQVRAEAQAAYPLGRIATPEDIAALVCFLISARASFLTGVCITV